MGAATNLENQVLTITMPPTLDTAFADQMIVDSKSWLLMSAEVILLDFKDVQKITPFAYRAFVILARLAKQGSKRVASVSVPAHIERQIRADGVASIFNPHVSVTAAIGKPAAPAGKSGAIDVTLINPFIEATVKTLKIQAQTESVPGRPYLLKVEDKTYNPAIGIVGLITLSTSKFSGTIALALSEQVFLNIYEKMFGEKHDKITSELQDAAAEILNIIYGTAKTELKQIPGFDLQPAIPTVLAGERISLHQKTREKLIILPFDSDAGPFQMEIAIEQK